MLPRIQVPLKAAQRVGGAACGGLLGVAAYKASLHVGGGQHWLAFPWGRCLMISMQCALFGEPAGSVDVVAMMMRKKLTVMMVSALRASLCQALTRTL